MMAEGQIGLGERSFRYSVRVVKFINKLPEKRASRIISDQIIRSATSIGANILEGKGAATRKDYINFHYISLKSANETAYWWALLKEGLEINDTELDYLKKENDEIARIIGASLTTPRSKK